MICPSGGYRLGHCASTWRSADVPEQKSIDTIPGLLIEPVHESVVLLHRLVLDRLEKCDVCLICVAD